jgi:uncharacterized membrane protein
MEQPSPSPQALSEAEIAQLRAAVDALSNRVADLEKRLDSVSDPRIAISAPLASSVPSSSGLGLTAINRIGALTLAIGITFFFKYAADNKWIGPSGRVLIGLVVGIVLLGGAEWLRGKDQRILSQGIAACGLAILYISFYAGYAYYKLIAESPAAGALLVVCVLALVISARYRNAAIAVLGFSEAILAALLLRPSPSEPWLLFHAGYLLAVMVTAVVLAVVFGWRILIPATAAMVVGSSLFLISPHHPYAFVALISASAAGAFAAAKSGEHTRSIFASAYVSGHALVITAFLRVVASVVDETSTVSEVDSVLLGLYGLAILTIGVARGATVDRGLGLTLLAVVIAKLYLYDIWQLNYAARIAAFVVLGIVLLAASFIYSRFKSRPSVSD